MQGENLKLLNMFVWHMVTNVPTRA